MQAQKVRLAETLRDACALRLKHLGVSFDRTRTPKMGGFAVTPQRRVPSNKTPPLGAMNFTDSALAWSVFWGHPQTGKFEGFPFPGPLEKPVATAAPSNNWLKLMLAGPALQVAPFLLASGCPSIAKFIGLRKPRARGWMEFHLFPVNSTGFGSMGNSV